MRKWISLLLAMVMLFTAGISALSEEEDDGDDSIQVPMDVPENGTEDEGETTETELRQLAAGDEGDDVLYLQMRLKSLKRFAVSRRTTRAKAWKRQALRIHPHRFISPQPGTGDSGTIRKAMKSRSCSSGLPHWDITKGKSAGNSWKERKTALSSSRRTAGWRLQAPPIR